MASHPARSLRREIEAQARRLGFQLVGVTTPDPPEHFAVFERWLELGRQGEMGYLATDRSRQRRADPRQILPECRSILCLGIRYPVPLSTAQETPSASDPRGRLAAYAWGDDYHDVLAERLESLAAFIETQAGHPAAQREYTDTGPLLERDLAQRAGLGWIGKNTCLIHPRLGSYFLLAEILLDIDLEVDPPFQADRCGSCTRCLQACPTACILPDRTIDSRRCISYLTIELKGAIPRELRPLMGEWVFGCDVCQQVCPWNLRFASSKADPAFAPRPDVPLPHLIQELALTPEGFKRKFKRNPVLRPKHRGYLRNVAVALGNSRNPQIAPALTEVLRGHPEPLVRGHAAWALGQAAGALALQPLKQAAATENDAAVLAEIQAAIFAINAAP